MPTPFGKTIKDYLAWDEMCRLVEEFARWRIWNWSVWASLASCGLFTVFWTSLVFTRGEPYPAWGIVAWRLAPALILLPAVVFQQYLLSRFTLPALFRGFGVIGTYLVFVCALGLFDRVTGASSRLLHDRVAFQCLTDEPGRPGFRACRELIRAAPQALALFGEDEQLRIRVRSDPTRRFFQDLDERHRDRIERLYTDLLDAYAAKDFGLMSGITRQILVYVDDFKDTRSYEEIAKRGEAKLTEERHKRAVEDRVAMLRFQIQALEGDGDKLLGRARRNPLVREQLDNMIADIYVKDPNNRKAAEWKRQLAAWDKKDGRSVATHAPRGPRKTPLPVR